MLHEPKPAGEQLDGLKAAVAGAEKRLHQATRDLEDARARIEAESTAITAYKVDLADLSDHTTATAATEQACAMTRASGSSLKASPWVLTCSGAFVLLDDGDAPPRLPRTASVPADLGCPPCSTLPFAALEPFRETFFGRLRRLRLFRGSAAARRKAGGSRGGSSRGGSSSGDPSLSGEPGGRPSEILPTWASSESLGDDAMDDQTSERPAMTMTDLTDVRDCNRDRMLTTTTMCPDDDVHGDDVTERASTASSVDLADLSDHTERASTTSSVAMNDDTPPARASVRLHGRMLMIRNIPCRVSRNELVRVLDEQGFDGRHDYVHVPMSHRPKTNLGYAFVNLIDEADEDAFELAFNGLRFQGTTSHKVCAVQPARLQGSDAKLGRRSRKGR